MAGGEAPGAAALPGVSGRGKPPITVETREDRTAQKTWQGRLHDRESVEADIIAVDTGKGPGGGGRGKDVVRSRRVRAAAN